MMSQNEIGSADTTTLWRLSDILRRGPRAKISCLAQKLLMSFSSAATMELRVSANRSLCRRKREQQWKVTLCE